MSPRFTQQIYRQAAQYWGLPEAATAEKDASVVDALAAVVRAPLPDRTRVVFAGGTALARAHRVVQRMSEDIDLKVVVESAAGMSKSRLRAVLGENRKAIAAALGEAGFRFADPPRGRNENRTVDFRLSYGSPSESLVLRDYIKIELVLSAPRLPTETCSVPSLVHEAAGRPPEVAEIECVSLTETAAEKLVSLTRRIAGKLEGTKPDVFDRWLVRHVYDLHWITRHSSFDRQTALTLAREVAASDAEQFASWFPGYRDDPETWTRKAVEHLAFDPVPRRDYGLFLGRMVYGEQTPYADAIESVRDLGQAMWSAPVTAPPPGHP